MKKLIAIHPPVRRGPGRPRVGDLRIEVTIPQAVMQVLMAREAQTNTYRTRVAANVLCAWASRTSGRKIQAYDLRAAESGPLRL